MLSIAEKMDERIRQPFHIGARCKESRDTFTHSIRNSSDTCRNDGRAEQLRFDQHVRRTLDARREQSRISRAEDRGSIASSAEQLKCASEISRRVREFVAHRSISRDDKHSIRDPRDRATRDFREQHRLLLIADPKHASDKHLMRRTECVAQRSGWRRCRGEKCRIDSVRHDTDSRAIDADPPRVVIGTCI